MKNNLIALFVVYSLAGCGGNNNDTNQTLSLTEKGSQLPPVAALPSNPTEKPTVDYDEQLLLDIEEFVKIAHAVQYFYLQKKVKILIGHYSLPKVSLS